VTVPQHTTDLVRMGEFGPFDALAEWAHGQFVEGYSDRAVHSCRSALLVVEAAGDVQTSRYLRYIEGIALQEVGRYREAVTAALDLLDVLQDSDDECWRAKALALLAESSVGAGELKRALDALAEGTWLVSRARSGSYGHVSASMAVALALRAMSLFEQAEELLPGFARCDDPAVEIHILLESALLNALWGASLDLCGQPQEAQQHFVTCAERALRMRRTAQVIGSDEMAARADVLEAFALSRLGSLELAAAMVLSARERFRQRGELVETQMVRLVLGQALAEQRRFGEAREHLDAAVTEARRAGRDVWAGVVSQVLADVDVAEHGRHHAVAVWKRLAREALQALWREREGRFSALQNRLRLRELSEETERIGRDVLVDPLTSLGNRRMLTQGLGRAGAHMSVVFLDVDRFKEINDTFSHDVGDQVLLRIATILRQQCRADDVVIRYGGDEFVVLVAGGIPLDGLGVDGLGVDGLGVDGVVHDGKGPDGADAEGADVVAERLHAAVRAARWDDIAHGLTVTVSVGAAHVAPASTALARADAALYAAKRAGRDRVVAT
jgi:diguanylate cyclase